MPIRIQRKRTRGWRMPEGAVYVARPSIFGNPFRIDEAIEWGFAETLDQGRIIAVRAFREWLGGNDDWWMGPKSVQARRQILDGLPRLRGKDLCCWCPVDRECHADELLRLANPA